MTTKVVEMFCLINLNTICSHLLQFQLFKSNFALLKQLNYDVQEMYGDWLMIYCPD